MCEIVQVQYNSSLGTNNNSTNKCRQICTNYINQNNYTKINIEKKKKGIQKQNGK